VDSGEATTATTTSLTPRDINSEITCAAGISTEAIAPEPAMVDIRRERRQMTRTPSSSDSAPATTAAAASPIEWPITAPGCTPYDFIAAASATCIVKMAGWIFSMPVTDSSAEIASVTENPDSSSISGSAAATVAANTGSADSSSAPIPAHCDPCPENTQTGPLSSRPTAA
jgi:hypothetical protein